jgi:NTE family protein
MSFFNRAWTQPRAKNAYTDSDTSALAADAVQGTTGPVETVVALGGGGARGAAHLGAMRRIAESDLRVGRIVGVSMGAFVGAMCAVESDIDAIQNRAIALLRSPAFSEKQRLLGCASRTGRTETKPGMFSWYQRLTKYLSAHHQCSRVITGRSILENRFLRQAIDTLVPDILIEDTETPLSIVAADLRTGQPIVLESGSLRSAVEASMAIPGIFQPVEHRGMLLCDIGAIHSLPMEIARAYPHSLAIGVDVSQSLSVIADCSTALDVMIRMEEIGERMHRRGSLHEADLIIRPHVNGIAWFDFHRVEALIDAGYHAACESLSGYTRRENTKNMGANQIENKCKS